MRYESNIRGQNFYAIDPNLRSLLRRESPDLLARHEERLQAFGQWVGSEVDACAEYTDRIQPPRLVEGVENGDPAASLAINPRQQEVHREVYRRGIVGLNYGPEAAPYLLSFAMGYLLSQADISVHCPATLTGAVAHVLDRFAPQEIKGAYLAPLLRMDGTALTGGTWATEREGGSDIGATTTIARTTADGVRLTGLKWFCSNAGSDLALATARPVGAPPGGEGLGLYLVPRRRADGSPNAYRIRRLKEKLGTRGLATGEIELVGASAQEVIPPPHGLKLMLEALEFSRVHNAFAAAAIQRRAFLEAIHYATHRIAFGHPIIAYPMVRDLLLDLQMELEASLALALAAARAFDAVRGPESAKAGDAAHAWLRILVALAKYRTAEEAVRSASRAIEVLGGIGYTEEYVTARLLRDAQVLPIWEGTANIQALELLRLTAGGQQGEKPFASRIGDEIADLPGALGQLAAPVQEALTDASEAVAFIRRNPGEGPRHARALLDLMADVACSALLLGAAAAEWSEGDARRAVLARRYVERRLQTPARRGLARGSHIPKGLFEAVVGYEPVEPADLTGKAPE